MLVEGSSAASPGAAASAGEKAATPAAEASAVAAKEQPAAAEPAAAEPKRDDVDLSPRFAALAKREKVLVEREKAAKEKEKAYSEWQKAKEQARLDPMAFLQAHDLSYDQVTEFLLNDRKLTDAQRLALVEERLKKEDEDRTTAAKEAQRAEVQRTIDSHKDAIKTFVDSDADTFELTRANDAYELVYSVIEQHWEESGQILPIEQAAKEVEAYLETQARERVLKLKRFQPKQDAKTDATPATTTPVAEPETRRPAPTLTNASVSSAPPADSDDRRHMSDEESKRRSAQLLRQALAATKK